MVGVVAASAGVGRCSGRDCDQRCDGKAVGEFGAVVSQHGMDVEREAGAEAIEKAGGGLAPAIGQDFEIDKAGGPIDGDISSSCGAC
jgi:hypothetical protein